jgi:hypothetical protein
MSHGDSISWRSLESDGRKSRELCKTPKLRQTERSSCRHPRTSRRNKPESLGQNVCEVDSRKLSLAKSQRPGRPRREASRSLEDARGETCAWLNRLAVRPSVVYDEAPRQTGARLGIRGSIHAPSGWTHRFPAIICASWSGSSRRCCPSETIVAPIPRMPSICRGLSILDRKFTIPGTLAFLFT